MGFFNQFSSVVEWNEFRDDIIFYKYHNTTIKKGSKLILKPGQDAVFYKNGILEGIFTKAGTYDIESQIIPFLSTLSNFKFGFNTPLRIEVLFVNTKEFLLKWGTRTPILIKTQNSSTDIPIRANGTYSFKVDDYVTLIDKIAGLKSEFYVDDIESRITGIFDSTLLKAITKKQCDASTLNLITKDLEEDIKFELDMNLTKIGLTITDFTISGFNYPSNFNNINQSSNNLQNTNYSNFCSNCGTKSNGGRFCSNCGNKL